LLYFFYFEISVENHREGLLDFLEYVHPAERKKGVKTFFQNCVKICPLVIDIMKRILDFPWHIPKYII